MLTGGSVLLCAGGGVWVSEVAQSDGSQGVLEKERKNKLTGAFMSVKAQNLLSHSTHNGGC